MNQVNRQFSLKHPSSGAGFKRAGIENGRETVTDFVTAIPNMFFT
jgi:hypothetical protein